MSGQSVFISVADPSADATAALLAAAIRRARPEWMLWGVGGEAMRGSGVRLLADTVTGSAMGLAALGRAGEISRLLGQIAAAFDGQTPLAEAGKTAKPSLVICIDSWSMNVHVAKLAKARGIPVLYYVAPQTWASREGRVVKMRQLIDQLACILPFEEPYFRGHGLAATYVGHPLWDRIDPQAVLPGRKSGGPLVAVLPGSRQGVTRANWPRLQRVMQRIREEVPGVRFRVPLTRNAAGVVLGKASIPDKAVLQMGPGGDVEVRADAIDEMLPGCDLALCVSGTAALHVAAYGVPLIVVYHGNPLLWHLIGRWVVRTRTYSLVNLLSGPASRMTEGRHVAPEYIPWYGSVEPVARHAIRLLKNPAELAEMRERLGRVVAPLAKPGATERVARMAVEMADGKIAYQKKGAPMAGL